PIEIFNNYQDHNVQYTPPQSWQSLGRARPTSSLGRPYGPKLLRPGEEWSETLYLHHDYSNIPSGEATITLTWPVRDPGDLSKVPPQLGRLLAAPSAKVRIHIASARPMRLMGLVKRMQRTLDDPELAEVQCGDLAKQVQYTEHKELIPIALRLLESRNSS